MTATVAVPVATAGRVGYDIAAARPRIARWHWWFALGCFVNYAIVGIWLLTVEGYAIFDSTSRTISAQTIVLSRDPHLGAMGFYWFPLPMLVRVPLVLALAPFGQAALAGPLSTALFGAATAMVLLRLGSALNLGTAATVTLVGIYALNPVTVFSAANGMSEAAFALCVACTMFGFIRFTRGGDVHDIAVIGMALAAGMATRVEFIPLCAATAIASALQVPRRDWGRTVGLVLLPPAIVFAVWSTCSKLLAGRYFFWYVTARSEGRTPEPHPWMPDELTFTSSLRYLAEMTAITAPVLAIAVITLVAARPPWRPLLGVSAIVATLPAFLGLQLVMKATYGTPRYFAMWPILGLLCAMWVLSAERISGRKSRVWMIGAAATAMVVGAVTSTFAYSNPTRTSVEKESVFFAPLIGREPATFQSYFQELEPLIADLDPFLADGARVAMDSRGGAALLLTRYPEQFVLPEDRDFEEIMSDPTGRFEFVVKASFGFNSPYQGQIEAAMQNVTDGSFVLFGEYGTSQVYRFEPSD
jgi:hypothetical protein